MHDEELFIAILAVGSAFGLPMIWLALHYFHATARVFFETRLKRDMVARGFSADEIIQVVSGKGARPSPYEAHGIPPAKPIRQPALQAN